MYDIIRTSVCIQTSAEFKSYCGSILPVDIYLILIIFNFKAHAALILNMLCHLMYVQRQYTCILLDCTHCKVDHKCLQQAP